MEGWVGLGTTMVSKQSAQNRCVTEITAISFSDRHASPGNRKRSRLWASNSRPFGPKTATLTTTSPSQPECTVTFTFVLPLRQSNLPKTDNLVYSLDFCRLKVFSFRELCVVTVWPESSCTLLGTPIAPLQSTVSSQRPHCPNDRQLWPAIVTIRLAFVVCILPVTIANWHSSVVMTALSGALWRMRISRNSRICVR